MPASATAFTLTSPDIPYNEGMARPITIKVPYGSLLNPRPPGLPRRSHAANSVHA